MKFRSLVVAGLVVWTAAVVTAAVAGRRSALSTPAAARTLASTLPGAGVEAVAIDAGRGSVIVKASPDDQIEATVTVSREARGVVILGAPMGDPAQVELQSNVDRGTLRLRLGGASGLDERWVVKVPARLSAAVALARGRIEVSGLEGGVRAHAEAGLDSAPGAILVDVPRGRLELSLGVGSIDARTGESPRGDISVRSSVGHAQLVLDGHEILPGQEPGPGEQVRLTGDGQDGIALRVSVGDARLRIR
ncbi:MAG TPA: hypothetical protein VLT86_13385 [Vicinamibacterales bacterium]|nr:hypothetical protein [Vicinamibacterales bacterium]